MRLFSHFSVNAQLVVSILFFLLSPAQAQTENPEGASVKYETLVEGASFNSASRVILDQTAIKKSKVTNLTSLLATQANISVAASSFQSGAIYLRGGDSSHVLVLVDGLPFYDPSTVQKTTDLNEIDIKSIRRIEIIKGSQSVLYGGQALSGVIKIDTLPQNIENKVVGVMEGGQDEYQKASLIGLKALDEASAVLGRFSQSYKNSRSPVLDSSVRYVKRLQSADLTYLYQDQVQTFFKILQSQQSSDLATSNFASGPYGAVDSRDLSSGNRNLGFMAGIKGSGKRLLVNYQNGLRTYENKSPTGSSDHYGNDLINVRAEFNPIAQEKFQLQAGGSYAKDQYLDRENGVENINTATESKGFFVKAGYQPTENWEFEGGLRTDIIDHHSPVQTYQIGATLFKEIKLEYAMGFKAPTLFQMYNRYGGGNPDLKSERSQTWTASYEHFLGSRELNHVVSVTVFDASFEDLVEYVGNRYENVARTRTRGIEAGYSIRKPELYRLDFNMGFQEPRDVSHSRWLARRPLSSGTVRLTVGPETTQAGFESSWVGARADSISQTQYGTLKEYIVTNYFMNHQFSDNFSGYVRVNNLENIRYESSSGYYDEGMFVLAGVEFSH